MPHSRIDARLLLAAVSLAVGLIALPTRAQSEPEEKPSETPEAKPAAPDANVDALVNQLKGGSGPSLSSLQLSGFADFSYVKYNFTRESGMEGMFGNGGAMWIGNLNLYLDAQLSQRARSLIEVRFTYLPHGGYAVEPDENNPTKANVTRKSLAVPDYTDLNRSINVGGVIIQRAWVEYRFAEYFTLRAGHFLTPYGIWNVDHGSPAIVGALRPFIIGQQLIPESQSGLEGYGVVHLGPSTQVGYHLTFSNGRVGTRAQYLAPNGKPGVGGRVYVESNAFGDLRAGLSGYKGRYEDQSWSLDFITMKWNKDVTSRIDEWSMGADVHWDWNGVLLNAEYLSNSMSYKEGKPMRMDGVTPVDDERRWGAYLVAGYRLPFLKQVMPFGMYEFYRASEKLHHEGYNQDFTHYPSGVLDIYKYKVGS